MSVYRSGAVLDLAKMFQSTIHEISSKQGSKALFRHTAANSTAEILCVEMLLINLLSPQWIHIDCNLPRCSYFVCTEITQPEVQSQELSDNLHEFCHHMLFRKGQACFGILWSKTHLQDCLLHNLTMNFSPPQKFQDLAFIMQELQITPVKYNLNNISVTYHFDSNRRIYTVVDTTHQPGYQVCLTHQPGYQVCEASLRIIATFGNIFMCRNGSYVSVTEVLDGKRDCVDNSDEDRTTIGKQIETYKDWPWVSTLLNHQNKQGKCFIFISRNVSSRCVSYMHNPYSGRNHSITANVSMTGSTEEAYFICKDSQKIQASLVNDLRSDCPQGEDEQELFDVLHKGFKQDCNYPNQIPCLEGHSRCFEMHELCVYTLSPFGVPVPCSNGQHLGNCSNFQCNKMFKCFGSYCVPWQFVCDGQWHCLRGDDESAVCTRENRCESMYVCKDANNLCIHLGAVCDDIQHCPHEDDELLCELTEVLCPEGCFCWMLAISCSRSNVPLMGDTSFPFSFVHLSDCTLQFEYVLNNFKNGINIEFIKLNLTDICDLDFNDIMVRLVTSANNLTIIMQNCLVNKTHLTFLEMDQNEIRTIKPQAFVNLLNLKVANFSHNSLLTFSGNFMVGKSKLLLLSLRDNNLKDISDNPFEGIPLKMLEVSHRHLCCFGVTETECFSDETKVWFSSCDDILSSGILKFLYILVAKVFCWGRE